jgi:hypothetical protein
MRSLSKYFLSVLAAAALGLALSDDRVSAQGSPPEIKQIKLTDEHVLGFIAAQKELKELSDKLQAQADGQNQGTADKPDLKLQTQLEQIAKKHGFLSFDELDDVATSITIVLDGIDQRSGNYTDPIETIKKEMEQVNSDNSLPNDQKEKILDQMAAALKVTPPLRYAENIDVVKKYRAEIAEALD